MNNYSEETMADAFIEFLKSKHGKTVFPKYFAIYREVICRQGITDILAIEALEKGKVFERQIELVAGTGIESSARILSLLSYNSPRTEKYLMHNTGLTIKTFRRTISELLERGIIVKNDKGSYKLEERFYRYPAEIWAFELKLNDWKRAIFQAMQYKAFASKVITVFPEEKEKLLLENLESFRRRKIGLSIFDANSGMYKVLLKPMKERPSSKKHYFYTLSKIAGLLQES